jgi:hypothetical protein
MAAFIGNHSELNQLKPQPKLVAASFDLLLEQIEAQYKQ